MTPNPKLLLIPALLSVLVVCIGGTPARAGELSASWFSMTSNDPDVGVSEGNGGNAFVTTVGAGLGPNGLPVLNATGQSILHDFNENGELLWWSTENQNVSVLNNPVYPAVISLPFTDYNMFTNTTILGQNGDDANAFLTAMFVGDFTLSAPGSVSFNACSDDDEFVYLSGGIFGANGTMVVDNGGIHGLSCTSGNVNTSLLSNVPAGSYTLTVFYADRQRVAAAFQLSSELDLTPPGAVVPEPGTAGLLGLGLAGIARKLVGKKRTC